MRDRTEHILGGESIIMYILKGSPEDKVGSVSISRTPLTTSVSYVKSITLS